MLFKLSQTSHDLNQHAGALLVDKALKSCRVFEMPNISSTKYRSDRIDDSIILSGAIISQAHGLSNFHDINEITADNVGKKILGCSISEETYRQRLDSLAKNPNINSIIDEAIIKTLKKAKFLKTEYGGRSYYTLDIDVTPFTNENNKKEGISKTYKKEFGYAPINAYLNNYAVAFELRPGSQHSECGAEDFLKRCLKIVINLGLKPEEILLRVDSGHDAESFISLCIESGINFIVKRNFRREKNWYDSTMKKYAINNIKPVTEGSTNHYYFTRDEKPGNIQSKNVYSVFEVRESPLPPEEYPLFAYGSKEGNKIELKKYEVDGYWTNIEVLGDPNKYHNFDRDIYKAWTCVHAYHEHATSEQFHSELKSDMKMELLPSGKFATNSLFLQLGAITFNILRLIGDMALDVDPRFHHHKHEFIQRIRLSTVIEKLCKVACQLVKHSRRLIVQFGKSFTFYRTFKFIYNNV